MVIFTVLMNQSSFPALFIIVRQTWATHTARAARSVGTLSTTQEDHASEMGVPTTPHALGRSTSSGGYSDGIGECGTPGVSDPGRLSRTGSTSVMSVSEFYGPSGARMLQRRGSSASHASLLESYGEGEAALSRLMAATGGDQQQQQPKHSPVAAANLVPNPWCNLPSMVKQMAAPGQNGMAPSAVHGVLQASVAGSPGSELAGATAGATRPGTECSSAEKGSVTRPSLPPPLTLEAPHPAASSSSSGGVVVGGSLVSLPWVNNPVPSVPSSAADLCASKTNANVQRQGMFHWALSVDTGSAAVVAAATGSPVTAPAIGTAAAGGSSGLGRSMSNPGNGRSGSGLAHSPRLRAKSMDTSSATAAGVASSAKTGGRKKGKMKMKKGKKGKGPGSAVMGKADKIGRMLQVGRHGRGCRLSRVPFCIIFELCTCQVVLHPQLAMFYSCAFGGKASE